MLAMAQALKIGDRVYLKIAVAGDPGVIYGFDKSGKAEVEWYDLSMRTRHDIENLILDEGFTVSQLDLFEFDEIAA